MTTGTKQDLVVLVPDKDIEAALQGLLARPEALGIRAITYRIYTQTDRDPGCLRRPNAILNSGLAVRFAHALVVLDHQGCGQADSPREELERQIVQRLHEAGWGECVEAVVIAPELENWVWSDSPHVAACLGWPGPLEELLAWLAGQGLIPPDTVKPPDPKACVERVREHLRKPRSSAVYRALAEKVSVNRCSDPAFQKLRVVLRGWFGTGNFSAAE